MDRQKSSILEMLETDKVMIDLADCNAGNTLTVILPGSV
jgi:hypothetical protein